jgi:hypothetical protein
MSALLFLEFEGVLHPKKGVLPPFCRLPLLLDAIGDTPCQIIITSDWRFHYTLTELKDFFPAPFRHRILGALGNTEGGRQTKYRAIKRLLEALGLELMPWRALDSAYFDYPRKSPHLIFCHPDQGLSSKEADDLRHWLQNPQPSKTPFTRLP